MFKQYISIPLLLLNFNAALLLIFVKTSLKLLFWKVLPAHFGYLE